MKQAPYRAITEVTEAFDIWENDLANHKKFNSYLQKLEEDPHSPVSGALLPATFEHIEKQQIEPSLFELDNLISALTANGNWKTLDNTAAQRNQLASVLLTEAVRLNVSAQRYKETLWGLFNLWSGTTSKRPKDMVKVISQKLFGDAWCALYADNISRRYLENLKLINEAAPRILFRTNVNGNAEIPPDDLSP